MGTPGAPTWKSGSDVGTIVDGSPSLRANMTRRDIVEDICLSNANRAWTSLHSAILPQAEAFRPPKDHGEGGLSSIFWWMDRGFAQK